MKLNLRNFQKSITFLLVFFMVVSNAQNAIVGTGFAGAWPGACNSVSGATYLSANIGTTFGSTGLTPNGTGNQYWRLGIDWSGSIYQINNGGTTDALVAPNTTYNAAVTCQGSGALYYNVSNASYRYVFKTLNGGVSPTGTWVFFEVQGAVQNVSSVSASPSAAPPVNMPVTVTATTSGALSTGQAVYLRYTTNAWSTSTVVPMTGSGTTYNATIPGFTAGTNVSYYVFTSAPTNVATNGSNADLYTMTWNAGAVNGGSNYSYTVSATTANVWVLQQEELVQLVQGMLL